MFHHSQEFVCRGCVYATFHSCGDCFRECLIDAEASLDQRGGFCEAKETEEPCDHDWQTDAVCRKCRTVWGAKSRRSL